MNSTVHGKEVILLYRHESIQHDLVRERGGLWSTAFILPLHLVQVLAVVPFVGP